VLYAAADIGEPKAELAAARLKALNPFIEIKLHPARVEAGGLPALLSGYDILLDCTDNFATKYLLADAAILYGVPLVQASIHRFEGQLLTISRDSPGGCLRCLWPAPPPEGAIGNCAEVGVLGVVPGLFGTLQAAEALKYLLGLPGLLDRHLLIMDALTLDSRLIARRKDPACPLCGEHPSIHALAANQPGADWELDSAALTPQSLAAYRLVDLRETDETAESPLPEALHAPFSSFNPAHPPFDDTMPVLLVCARGRRSKAAAEQLRAQGWRDVFSLIGGVAGLFGVARTAAE
jgi:adenylyltransferase/sulfurtransferase